MTVENFHSVQKADASLQETNVEAHSIYSSDELRQRSQSVFFKVDRNSDGLLTNLELTDAASNKDFNSVDFQVIESLLQNHDRIKTLSDDEWGTETGIAMEDLDHFAGLDERSKRHEIDAPIEAWFGHSNNFAQVDTDADGYVSSGEIETRLNSKKIDKLEVNALERMKTTYAELMNQSNDEWGAENNGISRADINAHVTGRQQTAREIDAAKHALNVMHRVHKQQHSDENTALTSGELIKLTNMFGFSLTLLSFQSHSISCTKHHVPYVEAVIFSFHPEAVKAKQNWYT